jgi:hypothetical protein
VRHNTPDLIPVGGWLTFDLLLPVRVHPSTSSGQALCKISKGGGILTYNCSGKGGPAPTSTSINQHSEGKGDLDMPLDQKAIIQQIDDIVAKYHTGSHDAAGNSMAINILFSAIHRLAPPGSVYIRNLKVYESRLESYTSLTLAMDPVLGILQALRNDYESGYLQSVVELVHAEIFADFTDMADYLLQQGYKDPAAVIIGSVLEAHLRKLCGKHSIDVVKADGTSKKADTLNSELTAAGAYSKLDQKSVTAWLDLRNKAAHGQYAEYTKEQVVLMLQSVRDFAARYPA